jgi:undecaprenyl-diphosphooligosaccharide---protein glycotransferase
MASKKNTQSQKVEGSFSEMDSKSGRQSNEPLGPSTLLILGLSVSIWLASVALRVIEWPVWADSAFWRDGSPLLPNPDTYAWLAGAVGSGRLEGWAMSEWISLLSGLSGQSPEWVAFWLPVVLAGVPGVLLALLCAIRGHPAAAWVAGILGASSLGYLGRTRLGYTDTDLFALALAVALAWSWATSMLQLTRPDALEKTGHATLLYLGLSAFICWLYAGLYPSAYPLALAIVAFGAAFAMWRAGTQVLSALLCAISALLMAAHFGLVGLIAAWLLLLAVVFSSRMRQPSVAGGILAGVLIAVAWTDMWFLEQTLRRIGAYTGLELAVSPVQDWKLPGVEDSIVETNGLALSALAERLASHWLLVLIGLTGFVVVLRRWPDLVTFIPLLLLGLASFWLGPRFAMYAGPPLALGLALGLALILTRAGAKPWQAGLVQGVLATGLFVWLGWRALEPAPDPALEPGHADALAELRHIEANRGRVWSWWDRGYAAQFYSAWPTLADGASASRQRIFSLGQVFGTHSPLQAAQVMKLGALARAEATDHSWMEIAYQAHPLQMLARMPAKQAQAELDRLAVSTRLWPEGLPDEFLVVDWRTLRQAQWISYFGRWRLDEGEQGYGQVQTLQPPVELDTQRGLLHTPEGPVALLSIDILEHDSHYRNSWPHAQGAHAVINNINGQGVLMDGDLYGQMAVQMLIGEPAAFEPHFELIIDQSPAARVYRVR